ncbi:zinc finger protein 14-like [Trichoplusia ni]|uniref:Zinc finger protein 14-like n=1 Tax=Trichoplusia ni TaxID=7111 RepID=A0A7E5VDQ0_TRINI|nr:zinc finger protein 14-like [Trichoplusia ni]
MKTKKTKMVMGSERIILKCRHCSKEFKYDSERRRHEQSHFPAFQCKVCNKNFSFVSALRRHEKQHERTGSVRCSECGREFRDNILLKRHTKYAHGGTYTCSKCSATFSSEPALSTHMKTHKTESERRYQCSFTGCSKKFNFAHHLKHHELTHTNTKQHYCKICNKGFIQSHHLKTHLKTHNADSSLCCTFPDCNKKFATEFAKKRHMAKHHPKTDSGISSDSNSTCDLSCLERETIICSSCNFTIPKPEYEMHLQSCMAIVKEEYNPEHPTVSPQIDGIQRTTTETQENVLNCKSVLGGCIMSEKGETCVCVQIPNTVDEDYDFDPIDNEPLNLNKLDSMNSCKGCDCFNSNETNPQVPHIVYKTDGTVKIKDTFDIDLPFEIVKRERAKTKFVPYNSCKAILGNCIVSGNGTISDECLCAKMALDEQVTAQEIDDITPRPNTGL